MEAKGSVQNLKLKLVDAITREVGGVTRDFDAGDSVVVAGHPVTTTQALEAASSPQAPVGAVTSAMALQIAADETKIAQALVNLRRRIHAFRTIRSRGSRLKLALEILRLRGLQPFPLTREAMEVMMAVLVEAKYRSAQMYVSALRVENPLRGHLLEQSAAECCSHLRRASARGLGDPKHSEPLTEDVLLKLEAASRTQHWKRLRFLGYVVAWHVLLRGDELTVLSCGADRLEIGDGIATIHITGDKTNITGRDKARVVGCCCSVAPSLCPAHACTALLEAGRKRVGRKPLGSEPLLCREDGKPYSNQSLLYWFRLDLEAVGVKLLGKRREQLWGLHAFRRGGAQALARARWSFRTIQAWARWESHIIQQHVAEAPLAASTTFASTIVGGSGMEEGQPHPKHAALLEGPLQGIEKPSKRSGLSPFGKRTGKQARVSQVGTTDIRATCPLVETDALLVGGDALLC